MSEVTEITGEGDVQLEVIEINGGTIEVIGEDKTTIEIVESTSTTNDLDISTQTNIVVVDSNPSEGTSLNISEDSPTTIEIASPPVSVDIIDKILVSGTSDLSFNNLVDKPFAFDSITQRVIVNNISSSNIITNTINAATGSFSHIEGNSPITFKDEAIFLSDITASGDVKVNGVISSSKLYTQDSITINSEGEAQISLQENNTTMWSIVNKNNQADRLDINNSSGTTIFSLYQTEGVEIKQNITTSANISASGLLFISASEDINGDFNQVVLYDSASGRLYYTGSYGGSGNTDEDSILSSINPLLQFNGNRFITRNEAGTFTDDDRTPTLNLGTSGSVLNFLEAYFFPNDPPTIDNGNGNIELINEFTPSGSTVHTLTATDKETTQGIQTLTFSTTDNYTTNIDAFRISTTGEITLNILATSSLNTEINSFYDNEGAHKFPVKVEDTSGGFVEEDLFLRIKPNTSPQFRINNINGEVVTSPQIISLFETSSFTGSIGGTGLSSIPIIHFTDNEGDSISIVTSSLSDKFTGSFELIINETNVELSQSISSLNSSQYSTEDLTFHLTASDQHFNSTPQQDNNSTSSLSFTINIIDNDDPVINNNRLPAINEKSPSGTISANLTSYPDTIPVLQDPDENEILTVTNVTLIGAFLESIDGTLSENLTSSYSSVLGTSLLNPSNNPFEIINNDVKRKSSVFLNSDLINLYKYNITATSTTTGLTGSSGIIEIPIEDHIKNSLQLGGGNGAEGHIIESSIIGNFVSADSNGRIDSTPRAIIPTDPSTENVLQNWIVTSSDGDFFEAYTFGTFGVNYTGTQTDGTGSKIQIRLKNNISGSTFTSGSIVTCSITASQDDFPTTKQFFEFPVNITENQSPTLTPTNITSNWFNTTAIKDVELVTIQATDPELDNLNDTSFQLIGNSSTYLSTSFASPQNNGNNTYSIRANDTLRNSPTYPTFSFTASLSDTHNFRTSSYSGEIHINSPLIEGIVSFNNDGQGVNGNEFYLIETAVEGDKVVKESNGQSIISNTQGQIGVNFDGSTGGINNSIASISIDNDILSITTPGGLLSKGPTPLPSDYIVGDYITASLTITDAFQNTINSEVSVSIALNFPPGFTSEFIPNLTSSLTASTVIANVNGIKDKENNLVTITSRRTDTQENLTVEGSGDGRTISIPTAIDASSSPINLEIEITASDGFSETYELLAVPIFENTPPTFNIIPTSTPIIAGEAPTNTVIATVTTESKDFHDVVNVTVDHSQLAIFKTNSYFEVKLNEDILGTNNIDTIISASIIVSDGLHTLNDELNFIVSGNLPPNYTVTTNDLVYPLNDGDEIATITNIVDDLNDAVTMTVANSNIPGGIKLITLDGGDKSIRVNQFINEFSNTTYTFEVTSSDSFLNESRSLVTLPNVTPALLPTFTSSSGNFRAGNYPQSHSVISLSEITDNNSSFLDTEYTINSRDSNFFLDNVDGEGFRIKAKTEIPGNVQTNTTLTGGVTASLKSGANIINQVSSSYTVIVTGNTIPNFSLQLAEGLIVPITSGSTVATITGVEDSQIINNQTFGPDIPFSASISDPTGIEGTVRSISYEYTEITANSNIGESVHLVTVPDENVILGTPTYDFGSSVTSYTYSWGVSGYQVESFRSNISLTNDSNNIFVDFSEASQWKRDTNKPGSRLTGPQVGGLNSTQITGNSQVQQSSNNNNSAYLHVETSAPADFETKFVLRSPVISLNQTNANEKLILYYYAYGENIGQFKIYRSTESDGLNTGTATQLSFDFYHTGSASTPTTNASLIDGPKHDNSTTTIDGVANAGKLFHRIECDLSGYSSTGDFFIYFEYTNGALPAGANPQIHRVFRGDFAIDNIHIIGETTVASNQSYKSTYITASHFWNDSNIDYDPQNIFNNESNYWLVYNQANSTNGGYVHVDFDFESYLGEKPIINKIDITQDSTYYNNKYQISGSDDSNVWVNLYTETEEYNTETKDRSITFNNSNGYKFYRIATDKGFNADVNHGPGLKSAIFYKSSTLSAIPYTIVSQVEGDTTNWDIKYIGDEPINQSETIAFDVNIADVHGNTNSEELSINYSNNTPPTYTVNTPLLTINSPITSSQVIATINNITDGPDNDVPYTCSVFNNDGTTINTNFVASTGSNTDTTNFNISCSSEFISPLNNSLNLIIKVEDSFGSFTTSLLNFDIIGDNVAPTVIIPTPSFEVDEHRQNGYFVGTLTHTPGNSTDIVTFGTSNNYNDGYFSVAPNGNITANVHLSASYNTIDNGGELKHKLIVTASDQHGGSSPDTDIFIKIIPNVAPIFSPNNASVNFGSFNEFINVDSVIGTVNATDYLGINNTPITYKTASNYTHADQNKIAVNCNSSTGELTFRIPTTESMHNFNDNTSHSVIIEALDNHGNVASQSVNFNIIPNEAPKFRIDSTAGTIISSPYTASIDEDETAFTQSFFYSDSNAEDIITINSTSPEPFNSYWDIYNISAENKIEIRQKPGQDLEFDTHGNSFHFTLSASDNHFTSNPQQDPNSQTTIAINLALSDGVTPTFNNTINGVTESAAAATTAGTIDSSNFSSTFTIEAFTINSKRLDGGSSEICTPGFLGNSATNTPADDPFELDGNNIKLKNGVYFNSDIFNSYRYSASIKSPGGNVNSTFINIPIKDQHPGTFNDSDTFNIIESAIQGNYIVSDVEGFGSNQSSITFTPPSEFNTSDYSFEVSSSNQFFDASPTTGNTLNFQLNKNLSGSSAVFLAGNSLPIEFTASLVDFPTSKLFGTITPTITPNLSPPLTQTENTDNWNDVSANNELQLVTLDVGPDPENDALDPTSLTFSPTTHLTASFTSAGSNQIIIKAKDNTTLSVVSSPYEYTASISDIHGFRSSSVSGSISLIGGDLGTLITPSNMYVLDEYTNGAKVLTANNSWDSTSGLGAQLSVTYLVAGTTTNFTNTSKPNNYFSIDSSGNLTVNNITSAPPVNINEEIHFVSSLGTAGTGSITVNNVQNLAPSITFTPTPSLQFNQNVSNNSILGTISVTDPENLGLQGIPTLSSITESPSISGNTINITGTGGSYNIIATSDLVNTIVDTTITFNITATDNFGTSATITSDIDIIGVPANPGVLQNSDGTTTFNFNVLETSDASTTSTISATPLTLDSSKISSIPPPDYWQSISALVNGTTSGGGANEASLWDHDDSTIEIIYDFTTPTIIGRYAFYPNTNMDPKGGLFKGSHDGITYSTLDNFPFIFQSGGGKTVDRSDNTWSGGVNNTAYRFYKFIFGPDYQGTNYMALYEIEFYDKTTTAGENDPVVTNGLGLPITADRVILSASFGNTSENNPIPNFSIVQGEDYSEFFHISSSGGLGYLQVSPTFNAVYNNAAPTTITPRVSYVTQNGTQGPTQSLIINIKENFGPNATQFTPTTGTYMTASNANAAAGQGPFIRTDRKVFTIGGITDVEGDDPFSVSITSGNVAAGDITLNGSGTGSFEVFPTSTITNNDTGASYNFNFRLTDSKGKFRNFINNQFTIATPVLEEPFTDTKIYIYTSTYNIGSITSAGNYRNWMLGYTSTINTPPTPSIADTGYNEYYVFPNFISGELGNNFTMDGGSQVTRRKTINVTSPTNLNEELRNVGAFNVTPGVSEQTLIIFPNTSDITGKPSEMTVSPADVGKFIFHVKGGNVAGTTEFEATTAGVDDFDFANTREQAQVHVITLNTAHEGYTEWYVIGMMGGITSNTHEIRVIEQ